ncbi:MAG: polysaccharide biosynthesis tyrosine autokinase [Anaerolineae bacterium]|nr:polysaccharide biosynthesis tyrosine autokinase [Anaerolineae bacterium]
METELVQYIRLVRRWLWLIVLAAFLAGGAAYLQASRQLDLYQARATISVGTYFQAPNPTSGEIYTGMQLAQNYVILAKSHSVLQAAIDEGNLPISVGALSASLSASVVNQTTFIQLSATHPDPILVVQMVDEVAKQLILNSPTNLTPEQQAQVDLANSEIARLNMQLEQSRQRLAALDAQIATATDPQEIERLNEQYNTVISQINEASSNIAWFTDTIARLQQRTNALEIVEPARLAGQVARNEFQTTILGALVGAALAFGLMLLIEYLDDTIRTVDQATQTLSLPTLAVIPKFGKSRASYSERLIAYRQPDSPVAEEYRTLRTNLMFSANGGKAVFIVTSPGPGDGKTVTIANLAVTMAVAGWRVLLIDADLRRPRLHDIFGAENRVGLSTLLALDPGDLPASEMSLHRLPPHYAECIQETEIPGLSVIASGYIPLNPAEVLGSANMQQWFRFFRSSPDIDIILIDTPPVLIAADSAVLASNLDIPAVMVIEAGRTRPGGALRARDRLASLEIDIKGLVLNAVSRRDEGYGYGHDYYYYYYYKKQEAGEKSASNGGAATTRRR